MSETEVRVNCGACRARDVDQAHVERCTVRTKARADAIAHGRGDIGIHAAKTDDLWAHVFSRTGDPILALDVTRKVIDLGWRPVVPSPARLTARAHAEQEGE